MASSSVDSVRKDVFNEKLEELCCGCLLSCFLSVLSARTTSLSPLMRLGVPDSIYCSIRRLWHSCLVNETKEEQPESHEGNYDLNTDTAGGFHSQ